MDFSADLSVACDTAAQWILEADALVVGTGAGMGVDSGLPTCRGRHSSTRLRQVGFGYADMCNAQRLIENPSLAWTFWVHCQNLYATAVPHEGYGIIRSWAETMPSGAFSYTTNVDGHWSVAGWGSERIYERHGSVFSLQCSTPCCSHVWPELVTSGRVKRHSALPSCPTCQAPARPNVVMDSDTAFVRNERGRAQQLNYKAWKKSVDALKGPNLVMPSPQAKVVCLEIGASTVSPHVRTEMEKIAGDMHARGAHSSSGSCGPFCLYSSFRPGSTPRDQPTGAKAVRASSSKHVSHSALEVFSAQRARKGGDCFEALKNCRFKFVSVRPLRAVARRS